MNSNRYRHACMADVETSTVYVMGGRLKEPSEATSSTESLKLNENTWNVGRNLLQPLTFSAAVASRCSQFVGYLAGGSSQSRAHDNSIWALRRSDKRWVQFYQPRLHTQRSRHSLVNVLSNEIPGC